MENTFSGLENIGNFVNNHVFYKNGHICEKQTDVLAKVLVCFRDFK